MDVKTTKSDYGWTRIRCPFCTYVTRESNKEDKLRWLKGHILREARIEAFDYFCSEKELNVKDIPHLEYAKMHTKSKKVVVTQTQVFDEDLKIKNG